MLYQNEYVERFQKIYYPGIINYWKKPVIFLLKNNACPTFVIHHVTNVFNDEWEIKEDSLFLFLDGVFYFITGVISNYEEKVVWEENSIVLSSNDITIDYKVRKNDCWAPTETKTVPREKWKPFELLLEIISLPEGIWTEETGGLFIGEKFPINFNSFLRFPAKRDNKNNCILIPKVDVIETLSKSGKIKALRSVEKQGDYIPFYYGCYKIL